MDDSIRWLIAIVTAFAGVGLGLFYQGKALLRPEDSKRIGRQLRGVGIIWIAIAIIYLIVVIILQLRAL